MGKGKSDDAKVVKRKGNTKMQLKRNIGYFDGVSFIIGSIVGAGIFVSPTGVLKHSLLNVGVALVIWTASGLVSLMGSLCYAELGTALPFPEGNTATLKEVLDPCLPLCSSGHRCSPSQHQTPLEPCCLLNMPPSPSTAFALHQKC